MVTSCRCKFEGIVPAFQRNVKRVAFATDSARVSNTHLPKKRSQSKNFDQKQQFGLVILFVVAMFLFSGFLPRNQFFAQRKYRSSSLPRTGVNVRFFGILDPSDPPPLLDRRLVCHEGARVRPGGRRLIGSFCTTD